MGESLGGEPLLLWFRVRDTRFFLLAVCDFVADHCPGDAAGARKTANGTRDVSFEPIHMVRMRPGIDVSGRKIPQGSIPEVLSSNGLA